jgi:hypothetical protein
MIKTPEELRVALTLAAEEYYLVRGRSAKCIANARRCSASLLELAAYGTDLEIAEACDFLLWSSEMEQRILGK